MLRFIFILLLLIHGSIHIIGFNKAFNFGRQNILSDNISKPAGFLWLITMLLFISAAVIYLLKAPYWAELVMAGAIISQLLIILSWKDAKAGTFLNIIIFTVALVSFAADRFHQQVNKEVTAMFSKPLTENNRDPLNSVKRLPPIVNKWLSKSIDTNAAPVKFVRLRQKGTMRTKPDGSWMPFTAVQYFRTDEPAFIWETTVQMFPLVTLAGRDRLNNGEGQMLIKLLSLFKIADAKNSEMINESTLMRFLAEICWFPDAALYSDIYWREIDPLTAEATIRCSNITATGNFNFNEKGDLLGFSGYRYKENGKTATKEKWVVETSDFKRVNGFLIPTKCKVTWSLKEGDFHWLTLEITDLEYNKPELYKESF